MDLIERQQAIDAVSRGCQEFRGIFAECEKNLNALPSAQPTQPNASNALKTLDCIDRQSAIDAICAVCGNDCDKSEFVYNAPQDEQVILCPEHYCLCTLPSAQPEQQHGRIFQEIVVEYPSYCAYAEYKGKPCFSIKYTENGQEFIGYGTYKPEVLSEYLKEYFMPSAQPEITRCCKCVYWQQNTIRQNSNDAGWWNEALCEKHTIYGNEPHEAWVDADWYCADAERRTDD